MGTDTRKVQFDFVARDQLSPAMQRMGQHSQSLSGKLSSLSSSVGGKLASMAKGASIALGAAAGSALVFGIKTAASMEQAQVAFTTMLGSAKEAKQFLGELQKFAAATPFELPQLTQASQKLLAYGFSAKQVIPTLTAIGDAASGLGADAQGIDQITTAIGQMTAKGKIQSDEILQLTEAGIPALKILANQYHVTTGAMQQMITDGVVKSSKAVPLLLQGIEQGTKGAAGQTTKFAGMMKQQSATLSGLFSTLKDNVSQALGNMVTPFLPALKAGLGWLVGATGKLQGAFQNKLVPAIQSFAALFQKGFKSADFDKQTSAAAKFGTAMRQASDWSKKYLVPALKDLWTWTETKLAPSLEKYVKNWLPGVRDAFKMVSKSVHDNQGNLKTLGEWLGKIVNIFVTKVIPILGKNAADSLRGMAILITNVIKAISLWVGAMKAFSKFFTDTMVFLTRLFLNFAKTLVHNAALAFGWIPGLGGKLKTADKQMSAFASNVNRYLNGIRNQDVDLKIHAQGLWTTAHDPSRRIPGLADGGPVPKLWSGASQAYDSQPALLRVNEHVWTPEEVAATGGHRAVERLRKAAKDGLLQGFATGGPVGLNLRASVPSKASFNATVGRVISSGEHSLIVKVADIMAAIWKKFVASGGGVVAAARSMIGYPYSWGGGGLGGPSYGIGRGAHTYGFDCSGLTQYAWGKGRGINIGGTTSEQHPNSHPSASRPGALAFPHAGHVMLVSDRMGYVIQAPHTGAFVEEVIRSAGDVRWPNNANFYRGGPVGQLGQGALQRGSSAAKQRLAASLGIMGRRYGGMVSGGHAYLVGERGPEFYLPRSPGQVSTKVIQQNITVKIEATPGTDRRRLGKEVNELLVAYRNGGGKLATA